MVVNTRVNPLSLSVTAVGLLALGGSNHHQEASALVVPSAVPSHVNSNYARVRSKLLVSACNEDITGSSSSNEQHRSALGAPPYFIKTESSIGLDDDDRCQELMAAGMPDLVGQLQEKKGLRDKMGSVGDDRIIHPELRTGEVPRLFSSLKYETTEDGQVKSSHAAGSVLSAAALVAGSTIGAGILALPTATATAGFLPSSAALGIAWVYMTISGLLIAELTLNRIGTSGRPGLGLLELYENSLGKNLGRVGSGAYFFLQYAIFTASISQGGMNLDGLLTSVGLADLASVPGIGQALFAGICAAVLFASKSATMEKINNGLVLGVVATFLGIVGLGSLSADFGSLVNPALQHPEEVVNCFPILFLSLVYQNVVPSVVTQLEGNRSKITNAIIAGTSIPFLMFLAFNAVVLGNALNAGVDLTSGVNPVALLQSSSGEAGLVGSLVTGFSSLAVITSLIGFTYGLLDAWTDVLKLPSEGKEFEQWKPALYGLIFVPPMALAIGDSDIFYNALDYAGAFGVSTLFLVLPPYMVWNQRYGDDKSPLATKPMVPFGKIPLASMYKAAGTLIVEQGFEKLGIFDFIADHVNLPSLHL